MWEIHPSGLRRERAPAVPARALVRSGDTDIDDPAVPHVVDRAEHLWGHLDDQRNVG
jgi:hypothetical protein